MSSGEAGGQGRSKSNDARRLERFLSDNEQWLMRRILDYASEHGYTKYTSTLEEAWRLSVAGLSRSLVLFAETRGFAAELEVDEEVGHDPAVQFGVVEAQTHRARGVSLEMFMSLMKYFQRTFLDLVRESAPDEDQSAYVGVIERFFDRVEIGYCVEWAGVALDSAFSELQRVNRTIINEKNKYLTIFQSLDEPVFLLDEEGRVDNLNAAARLFGVGAGLGDTYYSGVGVGNTLDVLDNEIATFFESGHSEMQFDRELETHAGHRHYAVMFKRMLDISGRLRGATVSLADVTQLKASNEHLHSLSMRDALTDLLNLRGLNLVVAEELPHRDWKRADLVFMDLDGMKMVNDAYGHAAGDDMLKAFADVMRSALRESDILARVGGDEFVALLVARDSNREQAMLERLEAGIRARNAENLLPHPISVSIGTSSWERDRGELDLRGLLDEADARMYEAKRLKHEHSINK